MVIAHNPPVTGSGNPLAVFRSRLRSRRARWIK